MAAPYRQTQAMGWVPADSPSRSALQLNAAANWYALSFIGPSDVSRTLSKARTFVSAVAGTLGASDITCDLYDSTGSGGGPGTSIEAGKVPSATITVSGWYEWTGFTTALTPGQQYWLVFKNVNATPASNNCTFQAVVSVGSFSVGINNNRFSWGQSTSTNSGVSWSRLASVTAIRVGYSDGSYDGIPTSNESASGNGVYATRELGVLFKTPPNVALRVAGVSMLLANLQNLVPTNGFRYGLWTSGASPTNLGYTAVIPVTAVNGNNWFYSYFSSPILLSPNTNYRATLATSGSDASSHPYNLLEFTWDTDSNSTILLPWEGTAQETYFNAATWADSALGTALYGHALLLDTAQEFNPGYPNSMIIDPTATY